MIMPFAALLDMNITMPDDLHAHEGQTEQKQQAGKSGQDDGCLLEIELLVGERDVYEENSLNYCLDAFEQGFISFTLKNLGPAKAVNFYANVETSDTSGNIRFPKQVVIENIGVNQIKTVKIPIIASKGITSGISEFSINVTCVTIF